MKIYPPVPNLLSECDKTLFEILAWKKLAQPEKPEMLLVLLILLMIVNEKLA